MGTFAKANVCISFEDKDSTLKAKEVLENFTEILKEEFKGYGGLYDLKVDDEELYAEFEISSERSQNMEWQCEVLPAILAKKGCKVSEFTTDMWMSMSSSPCFDVDGDNGSFEEFAKELFPAEKTTNENLLDRFRTWLKGGANA